MIDLRRMRYLMDRLPMARLNVERAMSRATKCTQRLTMAAGGGGYGDAMSENAIRLSVAREKRDGILRELRELREAVLLTTHSADLDTIPTIEQIEDALGAVAVNTPEERKRVQDARTWGKIIRGADN